MVRFVALDIEAASLDAKTNPNIPIWCVGFALRTEDDEVYSWTETWEFAQITIEALLIDESVVFLIHNAAFDIAALRSHDVNIPDGRYICTRLMYYVSDTQEINNGLGALARKHLKDDKAHVKTKLIEAGVLGAKAKDDEVFSIDYSHNHRAYEILAEYCTHDASLCLRLFEWLWTERYLKDEKLLRAFMETELPYVEVIIDMEATGMYIDTSLLDELNTLIMEELTEVNERINKEVGLLPDAVKWNGSEYVPTETNYKDGFNKNKLNGNRFYSTAIPDVYCSTSPHYVYDHCAVSELNTEKSHFTWFLMYRCGWKPEKASKKTGEPTTDKNVMSELTELYPIVGDIKKRRELDKLKGSFIDKINTIAKEGEHPLVKCCYNQCKTITTRLSSSDPNLQNIPSRSKLGKRIRDSVIAPDGYDLWVADLDAIELRVLAFYLKLVCGEDRMWQEFQKPDADPHTANQIAWNLPNRADAKKIFAVIYGGQAAAVGAYGNGGTPEQGQAILDQMREGMPAIWELMENVWHVARKRDGLLYTWFGNPIYYPDLNSKNKWKRSRAERQSFNCLIQGTAAGVNKVLGTEVNAHAVRPLGGRMAFAVHDENGAYIPQKHAQLFDEKANIIYNNRTLLKHDDWCIPVTGSWSKGINWNEAKGS
ncbi:DNA polymerase [Anabaena phage A-4L]|uniref:DNA polymerase n=1 Tax=Anabaena phage A-4L TaxID=1357732 RepID=A0A059PY40_9CAUD|nr:DNA polymerase [Anabaena phage A-4L]AGR48546.1 DNA polymerase [Anabaena phage A-4L]